VSSRRLLDKSGVSVLQSAARIAAQMARGREDRTPARARTLGYSGATPLSRAE